MAREGQPEFERSSSFARSLYQAAQQDDGGGAPAGGGQMNGERPAPPGMGRRQRSRRRLSQRTSGNRDDGGIQAAAAAAAAVNYEEGEPTENLPHMSEGGGGKVDRHTSWYTDALLQGGTEDLSAILGQVQDTTPAATEAPAVEDDEVLEQYRIMAHVEANIRVKDNTGFDMAEYEKRRKMNPEPTKGDYYSGNKKPKPKLPEPRLVGGNSNGAAQRPEEPPLPPPRPNRRFIEQRLYTPKVLELSPGIVVRGPPGQLPFGEHIVRCLGCKTQLRVNIISTLVQCPECSTVSPASSTRH